MAEIPQFAVGNWSMLLTIAERFDIGDALKQTYLFRGQENVGWSLKPTLQRAATNDGRTPLPPAEELFRIEGFLTDRFRGAAPNHLPSATLAATHALIDWWPLMRHYGVPTRLLDWTASLYVATYFAVSKCLDKDGAVYVVHVQTLEEAMKAAFGDAALLPTTLPDADQEFQRADAPPVINVFSRKNALLDRMIVQQGVFMTSRNAAADVEQVLATEVPKVASPGKEVPRKLRIPAAQKSVMMRRLRAMNATLKLDQFRRLSTVELMRSLEPGSPGALKAGPDGTVLDGHHRIVVLRERGIAVDALPREVVPRQVGE